MFTLRQICFQRRVFFIEAVSTIPPQTNDTLASGPWRPNLQQPLGSFPVTPHRLVARLGSHRGTTERNNGMTATGRDEFGGPCRVSTLPPLYPHCMRHQQHRCLYNNPPPVLPPRVPYNCTRPYLPQTCSDGHLEHLQRRPVYPGPPGVGKRPPMHPADGLLVLKVVSAACGEPDKRANYEIVSVSDRHGRFRKAVPCMPLALSIILCIVNMLAPGLGELEIKLSKMSARMFLC